MPNSALTIARWPELAEAYGALADAIASTRKLAASLVSSAVKKRCSGA